MCGGIEFKQHPLFDNVKLVYGSTNRVTLDEITIHVKIVHTTHSLAMLKWKGKRVNTLAY